MELKNEPFLILKQALNEKIAFERAKAFMEQMTFNEENDPMGYYTLSNGKYFYISKQSCITWDIIQAHPEFPWDSSGVSCNPNITWEIIMEHPEFPWDGYYVSQNPNITWDIIKKNKKKKWDFCYKLSGSSKITWENVMECPNLRWGYGEELMKNPNITWDIIKGHPEKPWGSYYYLSLNPNITWDIVKKNPHPSWNYFFLSSNEGLYEPTAEEFNAFFGKRLALRLWRVWFRAITNPDYALCRRRLMREFKVLKRS